MDDRIAMRIGALRLAKRRGRTRDAAWAAARLRLNGVTLPAGDARFARDMRVKFGHALRVARIRGPHTPSATVAMPLLAEPPRSRRRQLVAALAAAALLLGAILLYLRYLEPEGGPEGAPPSQQVAVVATPPPPLRGRTQPGLAVPVAVVEPTPAPTDGPTAPPATNAAGTGTSGGGTAGGGSGNGTGSGNGKGTPAPPTGTPRPTPTPTPAPTPTINPANLMHVQGRVVDFNSGRGIPGVCYGPGIISCAGSPRTDANGNWSMDIDVARNPNTTWRVVFITPGYQTGSVMFQSRRGTTIVPPIRLRIQ